MSADFAKYFTNLGLSTTETSTYLASLHVGPTSVQEIAKKAHLSRTTTYDAISSLQERGLMSSSQEGKKKVFSVEDPERVMGHFRGKLAEMQSQIESFARIVPELQLLLGGERPVVRFFEGEEAFRALCHDLERVSPERLDEVSNEDETVRFIDGERIAHPAHTRILYRGTLQRSQAPGVESCTLLPELGEFHGDIWIYANRVAFLSFHGKVIVVIVESESLAQTARVLFEAAWRMCSPSLTV